MPYISSYRLFWNMYGFNDVQLCPSIFVYNWIATHSIEMLRLIKLPLKCYESGKLHAYIFYRSMSFPSTICILYFLLQY